jgi:hypothetical protein
MRDIFRGGFATARTSGTDKQKTAPDAENAFV